MQAWHIQAWYSMVWYGLAESEKPPGIADAVTAPGYRTVSIHFTEGILRTFLHPPYLRSAQSGLPHFPGGQ